MGDFQQVAILFWEEDNSQVWNLEQVWSAQCSPSSVSDEDELASIGCDFKPCGTWIEHGQEDCETVIQVPHVEKIGCKWIPSNVVCFVLYRWSVFEKVREEATRQGACGSIDGYLH